MARRKSSHEREIPGPGQHFTEDEQKRIDSADDPAAEVEAIDREAREGSDAVQADADSEEETPKKGRSKK